MKTYKIQCYCGNRMSVQCDDDEMAKVECQDCGRTDFFFPDMLEEWEEKGMRYSRDYFCDENAKH